MPQGHACKGVVRGLLADQRNISVSISGMTNTKDKFFLLTVVVISVLAGMMLMQAIESYKNQEEIGAVEAGLSGVRVEK